MLDENTQVVQDLLAAWNAHDIERVATLLAADYEGVDVAQPDLQHGPQEQCRVLISYLRAFPNAHITGETVAQDNRVTLVWTTQGTHRGMVMHIPPTGRKVAVREVSVFTIEDGKSHTRV